MSSDKPIIAISGATGAQGGSLLRSLHATGKWKIRALTRDPNSDKAKKLAADFKDIEVVKGDNNSDDDLKNAFKGAHTVFAVTNFWDPEILADHKKEQEQGKRLVDRASDAGVKYFIWSSLADCKKESGGKYDVPHFDGKNLVEEYAKTKKNMKSIFFYASFYTQNFQYFFPPQKADDGTIIFAMPISDKGKIAMYDVNDTGKILAKVLENPDQYVNQDVSSAGDELTPSQIVETFSKVTGKKAKFVQLSESDVKSKFPGAMGDEIYNMFAWFNDYGYYGKRDPFIGKNIAGVQSFESWIKQSGWTGPQ